MAYEVRFAASVEGHLQGMTAGQTARVFRAIEIQLTREPLKETRNRKPLRPNPIAPWELRVGALRVFYDVVEEPSPTVHVLAIGVKDRDVLRVGGQEVHL
jgi:mRNA-degrading endonuclease RelE of RelBE toxin-antitoxin system